MAGGKVTEAGAAGREDAPRWVLHAHETLGSTSDEARRLAQEGAEEGAAVWARTQSAGRGRRGRAWSSPEGNLHLTVLLRGVARPPELGFVAAIAVADAVDSVLGGGGAAAEAARGAVLSGQWVRLKWPNDVMLGGAKLGGLLLEVEQTPSGPAVLVGIGVNLRHFPKDSGYAATSLQAAGVEVTAEDMRARVLAALGNRIATWRRSGFRPVRTAWLERGHRAGETLQISGPEGRLSGVFAGLDTDGALLARVDGAERRFLAAEIVSG